MAAQTSVFNDNRFNRTIEELKLNTRSLAWRFFLSFNRTIEELKRRKEKSDIKSNQALIEPLRN